MQSIAKEHPSDAARSAHSRTHPLANWRDHHTWSAGASLRRLWSKPVGTFLTITVMGLALALPLAFYLLLGNVEKLGDALGRSQSISAFLKPGQGGAGAELIARQLRERPDVLNVTSKTPQQGLDELAKMQGFGDALHMLDDNPLPYVLEVTPSAGLDAGAVSHLVDDMRAIQGVDQVQDSGTWRQRLDALVAVGQRVVLVLGIVLALAALLVVGNTVRVDIASRVDEIDVLLLVGASRAFVRRPYLYAGIWYGLFSGVIAAVVALAMEYALIQPVAQLSQAYEGKLVVGGLPWWLLAAVPVAAAVLGWAGARLISAWQLRNAA